MMSASRRRGGPVGARVAHERARQRPAEGLENRFDLLRLDSGARAGGDGLLRQVCVGQRLGRFLPLDDAQGAGGGPSSVAPSSIALVLACFLAVLGGGWRRLYGFAKAHDSLVPKGVQRRLDAQADAGLPAGAGPPEDDGAGD